MSGRHLSASIVLLSGLSLSLLACEKLDEVAGHLFPREGGRCKPDTASCVGNGEQLTCLDGKFLKRRCTGPGGCQTNGDVVTCAWGADQAGEPCSDQEEGNAVCAGGPPQMISCSKNKLTVDSCLGPDHCRAAPGEKMLCDRSVAEVGDSCHGEGAACTVDGMSFMLCTDGKFAVNASCRGPEKCKVSGKQVSCDGSYAEAGDPCTSEGGAACSVDKTAFLSCKSGKMVESLKCRGSNKCANAEGKISCDASLAVEGDLCEPEGGAACSEDRAAFLRCSGGKMKLEVRCACALEGDQVVCK